MREFGILLFTQEVPMGSGYSKMKKQKKQFAEQFAKMQEEMSSAEYTGESGGGLVKVVLSGDKNLKSLKIDPECVDPEDVEGLEDLIAAAFQDAASKLEDQSPIGDMDPLAFM